MKIIIRNSVQNKVNVFSNLTNRHYPRDDLVKILTEYNGQHENIEKLRDKKTFCVVTGQQLGLMGGPSYTILKAISCLLMAREYNAIPIFWLATEDHDVAEIDHTYLIDQKGNLQKFQLTFPKDGRFVEDLILSSKNIEEIKRFAREIGVNIDTEGNYSTVMKRFLEKMFDGTELIFVEPYLLRGLGKEFFKRELDEKEKIRKLLKKSQKDVGINILPFEEGSNLFIKKDGKRIKYDGEYRENLIFSTNVVARPALQCDIIPTIAYVAGPNEMNYFKILNGYFDFCQIPFPTVVPRLSATFIPKSIAKICEKLKISPWEKIPTRWIDIFPKIHKNIEELKDAWIDETDKKMSGGLTRTQIERYVSPTLKKIEKKGIHYLLNEKGIPSHFLHLVRNLVNPHNKPQERVLNWWEFQKNSKENLINEMLKQADWREDGDLYIITE